MKYLRNFETIQEAQSFIENFDGSYSTLLSCDEAPTPLIIEGEGNIIILPGEGDIELYIYVETTDKRAKGYFSSDTVFADISSALYNAHCFDNDGGAGYDVYYKNERILRYNKWSTHTLGDFNIESGDNILLRGVWM